MAAYRPDLANEFLGSVFDINAVEGRMDEGKMNDIIRVIDGLKFPEFPTPKTVFDIMYKRLMMREDFSEQLSPSQFDFKPFDHDPNKDIAPGSNVLAPITPESMGQLLDVLIHCSEGS